jgi:surface protein
LTTLDVSNFDTSKVTNMSQMFRWCSGLTELDLSSFDMSKVAETTYMLAACSDLQTIVTPKVISNVAIDLPASYLCAANGNTYTVIDSSVPVKATLKNVSSITADDGNVYYLADETTDGTYGTFVIYTLGEDDARDYQLPVTATLNKSDKTLTIIEVKEYPTGGVVIPAAVIDGNNTTYAVVLSGSPFTRLNTKNASITFTAVNGRLVRLYEDNTAYLFNTTYATTFATLDVSALDTSHVTSMSKTFYNCEALTSVNIRQWDTSSVTDMSEMFYCCSNLTNVDVRNLNTQNVENMYAMFFDCSELTELDLSSFDTSNVTNLRYVFYGCSSLKELDLSNFNTANVTSLAGLFQRCSGLTELDLSNFNTANVTDMGDLFAQCTNLQTINLTGWSYAKVISTNGMFTDCPATIIK